MRRTATPARAQLDDLDLRWAETLDRLRAFVTTRVGDREIAADITQDVIVRSIASGALERVDNPVACLQPLLSHLAPAAREPSSASTSTVRPTSALPTHWGCPCRR